MNKNITFTIEVSDGELPFLDTLVKIQNGNITTDLYYKPTDTIQYLDFSACHPAQTKRSIPYNLARRICMICSEETIRNKRLEELKTLLQKRGYPYLLISDGINKATNLQRENLLKVSEKVSNEFTEIAFVSTYNPLNSELFPLIQQNTPLLLFDEK